jgi:hypothetical protein
MKGGVHSATFAAVDLVLAWAYHFICSACGHIRLASAVCISPMHCDDSGGPS